MLVVEFHHLLQILQKRFQMNFNVIHLITSIYKNYRCLQGQVLYANIDKQIDILKETLCLISSVQTKFTFHHGFQCFRRRSCKVYGQLLP